MPEIIRLPADDAFWLAERKDERIHNAQQKAWSNTAFVQERLAQLYCARSQLPLIHGRFSCRETSSPNPFSMNGEGEYEIHKVSLHSWSAFYARTKYISPGNICPTGCWTIKMILVTRLKETP